MKVAVKFVVEFMLAGTSEMVTVGPVSSQVAVAETAEDGPVLKPSVAASAATVTTTSAEPSGVTSSV